MIVSAVLTVAGLGLVLGIGLVLASKYLAVEEDPKIERVAEELPGANCGGCGYAGCAGFAKAVAAGEASINSCAPLSSDAAAVIASVLGVELEEKTKSVAVVLCGGGDKAAVRKSRYLGVSDCRAAELVAGGDKECSYGCLGLGSCVVACPFDAIIITPDRLAIVDRDKCTACGGCVGACPRHIIKIVPEAASVHVLCSSKDKGKVVKGYCTVGCIACKLCSRESKEVFDTKTGLSVVDYDFSGEVPASAALVCAPQSILDTRELDFNAFLSDPAVKERFAEKQAAYKEEQKQLKAAKKAKQEAPKKATAEKEAKAEAKVEKAEAEVEKAEAKVEKAEAKVEKAEAKVAEAVESEERKSDMAGSEASEEPVGKGEKTAEKAEAGGES